MAKKSSTRKTLLNIYRDMEMILIEFESLQLRVVHLQRSLIDFQAHLLRRMEGSTKPAPTPPETRADIERATEFSGNFTRGMPGMPGVPPPPGVPANLAGRLVRQIRGGRPSAMTIERRTTKRKEE